MKKFIFTLAICATICLASCGSKNAENAATAADCDSVEVVSDTMEVVTDTVSTDSLALGEV